MTIATTSRVSSGNTIATTNTIHHQYQYQPQQQQQQQHQFQPNYFPYSGGPNDGTTTGTTKRRSNSNSNSNSTSTSTSTSSNNINVKTSTAPFVAASTRTSTTNSRSGVSDLDAADSLHYSSSSSHYQLQQQYPQGVLYNNNLSQHQHQHQQYNHPLYHQHQHPHLPHQQQYPLHLQQQPQPQYQQQHQNQQPFYDNKKVAATLENNPYYGATDDEDDNEDEDEEELDYVDNEEEEDDEEEEISYTKRATSRQLQLQKQRHSSTSSYSHNSSNSTSRTRSKTSKNKNTDTTSAASSSKVLKSRRILQSRREQQRQHQLYPKRSEKLPHPLLLLDSSEKSALLSKMISEMCFWDFPFKPNNIQHHNYNGIHNNTKDDDITPSIGASVSFTAQPGGVTVHSSSSKKDNDERNRSASKSESVTKNQGPSASGGVDSNTNNKYYSKTKKSGIELELDKMDDDDDGDEKNNDNKGPDGATVIVIPTTTWKQATDPSTGRIYYYDSITRKTQWEKPKEIRRIEKLKKQQQREADLEFFRVMEGNILASLERGECIPNVAPDHFNKAGPPREPSPPPTFPSLVVANETTTVAANAASTDTGYLQQPLISRSLARPQSIKVRTISGMDQHVLAQLDNGRSTSIAVPSATIANPLLSVQRSSLGNGMKPNAPTFGTDSSTNTTTSTSSAAANSSSGAAAFRSVGTTTNNSNISTNNNSNTLRPTTDPAITTSPATLLVGIDGRPPLAQRRSFTGSGNSASSILSAISQAAASTFSSVSGKASSSAQPVEVLSMLESLELSPDPPTDSKSLSSAAVMTISTDNERPESELRGVDLLLDDADHCTDDEVAASSDSDVAVTTNTKLPVTATNTNNTHIRRNTGGTMHFDTTMDNPDIDATMQCVCGVYRAHIVHYVESNGNNRPVRTGLEVFNDDYEQQLQQQRAVNTRNTNVQHQQKQQGIVVMPTLKDLKAFYQEFYQRSQMEHDTIIMSLIYVERLMKETGGALSPNPYNWRSILFSCMILASKVWDDLSMWNIDFSNVSLAASSSTSANQQCNNLLSAFSLQRINQLELAVLTNLNFRTAIPASEYAKYYFLIRTMLLRSGLLQNGGNPINSKGASSSYAKPLANQQQLDTTTMEAANLRIEDRSSRYQELLSNHLPVAAGSSTSTATGTITGINSNRRLTARSVDWSCLESAATTTAAVTTTAATTSPTFCKDYSQKILPTSVAGSSSSTGLVGKVLQDSLRLTKMGLTESG